MAYWKASMCAGQLGLVSLSACKILAQWIKRFPFPKIWCGIDKSSTTVEYYCYLWMWKMGSTAVWGTLPTPISEKAFNLMKWLDAPRQYLLHHKKAIWKVNLSMHCKYYRKLSHFYFKMPHCAFHGVSKSYRECEGASKVSKNAVYYYCHIVEGPVMFLLLQFSYQSTM